jgi:hypothetical protein
MASCEHDVFDLEVAINDEPGCLVCLKAENAKLKEGWHKPITEHPDVQRLIITVEEQKNKIAQLRKQYDNMVIADQGDIDVLKVENAKLDTALQCELNAKGELRDKNAKLMETHKRLHRRCQKAEAAAGEFADWKDIASHQRTGRYLPALMAHANSKFYDENERLKAENAKLKEERSRLMRRLADAYKKIGRED